MALFLNEREVAQLLRMSECIHVLEQAFGHAAAGLVDNRPRSRIRLPKGFYHSMSAADGGLKVFGAKAYTSLGGVGKVLVTLYDYETGSLLACMEAGKLGQVRTGAASGLATKYMARADASTVGIIGSGLQARTQLEAVCAVRQVRQARVYSRRQEKRDEFARDMSERLKLAVVPVDSAQECATEADIVVTITSARDPVLLGEWLAPGTHINAAGGNHWMRREIDQAAVTRCEVVVVDDLEQARIECGDLIWPVEQGAFRWDMAHELRDVVAGRIKGRPADQSITLFESQGVALEDIAAAQLVYRKAREQGMGVELPF